MFAEGYRDQLLNPGIVTNSDPPTTLSGMINVHLDPQGRLIHFQAIPPQKENSAAAPGAPFDWNPLFNEAGLDLTKFQKVEPQWNSLASSDSRVAWTGVWPGTTRPLRVEAASLRGKPVYFSLIGDWTKPQRVKEPEQSVGKKVTQILGMTLLISCLLGAVYMARRNHRRGRGDHDGAVRLALVMFCLEMLLCLCRTHLVPGLESFGLFILATSSSLFLAGLTWVFYLALEPWVRQRWPHTMISWSRLLSGQFRDPLVGRDILFGVMLGVVWILIFQVRNIPLMHLGAMPGVGQNEYFEGGRHALGAWMMQIVSSILGTLQFFFLLFALKLVLRKDWLAAIAFVAIFALPRGLSGSHVPIELPTEILVYAIAVLIVFRFGLIPLAVAIFTINMAANLPFSSDLSAWYMTNSILALLSVVALAAWGFYHSIGGELVWKLNTD